MPARRSEDPALTDAERSGEDALAHWDEAARRAARPAPFQRSLPNRDIRDDDVERSSCECGEDPGATSADDPAGEELSERPEATDE